MKTRQFVEKNKLVWSFLEDGRLSLRVFVEKDNSDAENQAIAAWRDDEDDVNVLLDLRFTLTSILDRAEGFSLLPGEYEKIGPRLLDQRAKPFIQAMRAELIEMVERIDALKYG
jgi:hypothetical protein